MTRTRRMTPINRFFNDAYMLTPGSCIVHNESGARLFRSGDRFRMVSDGGSEHVLDIDSTSPERLWAHWRGFTGQSTREEIWRDCR